MIYYIIGFFLICIMYYIFYYFYTKSLKIVTNIIEKKDKSKLRVVSYNIQRLPHLLKNNIDINKYNNYDIVCFQEYFFDLLGSRNIFFNNINNYNYCIPGSNFNYFVDSGLVILSKHKIEFINFITFKNSCSIDKYSQKGFIVVKILDIYVINTHLQSCYNNCIKMKKIINKQINEIKKYIIDNKLNEFNCLLVGDWNKNIGNILSFRNAKKIMSLKPTLWDDDCGTISTSTPYCINNKQNPYWYDGAFLYSDKYIVDNIKTKKIDNFADHLAIEFTLNIKKN